MKTVKTNISKDEETSLLFSFEQFKLKPIIIKGEFNNHYRDEAQYVDKMTILMEKALPLLSKEDVSIFSGDHGKAGALHLHKVTKKRTVIEKILKKYGFNEREIKEIFEGEEIYQLEVPYANGATRIVFQRVANVISFLFMDPNHHIYLNEAKTGEARSMFFEYCPVNEEKKCQRMDYIGTCFAFEFLDEEKYKATYGYNYNPGSE